MRKRSWITGAASLGIVGVLIVSMAVFAAPPAGYGPGAGPGYGSGYGPGYAQGYGPRYGMHVGRGMWSRGGMGAGGFGPMMWGAAPAPAQGVSSALQLSDDQQTEIETIFRERAQAVTDLQQQIQEKAQALQALLADENRDADALSKAVAEMDALRTKLHDDQYSTMEKVKSVLTTEQQAAAYAHMGYGPNPQSGWGMGRGMGGRYNRGGRRF